MQYNICDSQALFLCFALIILRMVNGKLRHFALMFSMPEFVFSFVLFFTKIKGFVLIKLLLYKKRVYMHNGKRILFSEFFSIRKSIPPTVWVERKRFHFVHQKRYLFGQVTAQSKMYQGTLWILRQLFLTTMSDRKP